MDKMMTLEIDEQRFSILLEKVSNSLLIILFVNATVNRKFLCTYTAGLCGAVRCAIILVQ